MYHPTNSRLTTDDPMVGERITCLVCNQEGTVVQVRRADMSHADPTESYILTCGHETI